MQAVIGFNSSMVWVEAVDPLRPLRSLGRSPQLRSLALLGRGSPPRARFGKRPTRTHRLSRTGLSDPRRGRTRTGGVEYLSGFAPSRRASAPKNSCRETEAGAGALPRRALRARVQ